MSTYIGFNLNSNRQIEHFQTIENRYGINSDGGKFLFGQAELALKGTFKKMSDIIGTVTRTNSKNMTESEPGIIRYFQVLFYPQK